jgi:hypothetical protein
MRLLGLIRIFGIRRTLLGWLGLFLFRRWLKKRQQRRVEQQPAA